MRSSHLVPLPVGQVVAVSAGPELEGLAAQAQVEVQVPANQLQREEVTLNSDKKMTNNLIYSASCI